MTKPSLAHRLAEFACSLNYEDLSPEVVHEVKRRVIDSFGCALGAWNEEPCTIARKVASDFSAKNGGDHHRDRPARRRRIGPPSPTAAAFVISITTTPIFRRNRRTRAITSPPRWRVGESVGATGRELITAIAIAYEVQCRLCDAASIRARGWDHPTYGAFSTALAAPIDETRSRTDAACRQYRGCRRNGDAAVTGRRAFPLERRRLCERGPARRLRRTAGARGHDRSGADIRRPDGIRERARGLVGRRR